MLRTVRIWGFSAEPIELQTAATTRLEVIESVGRQVPELKWDPVLGPKQIEIVGARTVEDLTSALDADVDIVPSFVGAKSGAGQLLLGGVLVALSFALGGGFLASFFLKVGGLLILGSLAQLLNPTPEADKDDKVRSQYLGPPKMTVGSGVRIPVILGRRLSGGQYLSFDVNSTMVRPRGAN